MQGLKVSSVGASIAFTIAGLRQSYPGGQASEQPLTKKGGDQNISPKIDELVLWEVAMQDLPTKAFDPDQLVMLAEVLNEGAETVEPPDDTAKQAMAERLGRILMQQFAAGTTDRETLRSLSQSEYIRHWLS